MKAAIRFAKTLVYTVSPRLGLRQSNDDLISLNCEFPKLVASTESSFWIIICSEQELETQRNTHKITSLYSQTGYAEHTNLILRFEVILYT